MKRQVVSHPASAGPHFWRGALLLVLLFALIQIMPIAFAQRNSGETGTGAPCNSWTAGMPYPSTILRYGFAQTATHFYVFGGVSNGSQVNIVNRMDISTGIWQARTAMPFTSEAPTCALMPGTNFVYCAEGGVGTRFARYDIVANTWTS